MKKLLPVGVSSFATSMKKGTQTVTGCRPVDGKYVIFRTGTVPPIWVRTLCIPVVGSTNKPITLPETQSGRLITCCT